MHDPRVAKARRLLILGSQMGQLVHEAIGYQVGNEALSNESVLVLFALDEARSLRPSQIQTLTGLSSGGVSKLLDRLEGEGLVRRQLGAVPEDRRASLVSLTPRGRRATLGIASALVGRLDELHVLVKELEDVLAG